MKKLLIILCVFISFSSCSVFKETKKNSTTKETESSTLVRDSVAKIETSKPIKDNIVINVPKSDNEAVNKALDAILANLNTSKTSGNNSYTSRYDAETNKLLIEFLIGQTQNRETATNSNSKTEKTFEQQTDEYIEKKIKRIPWWAWALAAFWFLPSIIQRVQLVLNPLFGLLKSFKG